MREFIDSLSLMRAMWEEGTEVRANVAHCIALYETLEPHERAGVVERTLGARTEVDGGSIIRNRV